MPELDFHTVVSLSCREAFNLASDPAGYADFLPALEKVEVQETRPDGIKARFKFKLNGLMDTLSTVFKLKAVDPVMEITWKNGHEITSHALESPLKSVVGHCTFKPTPDNKTRLHVNIKFETGKGWLADKAAGIYLSQQGNTLMKTLDSDIADALQRRAERRRAAPG